MSISRIVDASFVYKTIIIDSLKTTRFAKIIIIIFGFWQANRTKYAKIFSKFFKFCKFVNTNSK